MRRVPRSPSLHPSGRNGVGTKTGLEPIRPRRPNGRPALRRPLLSALFSIVFSTAAIAKGTGYVFVSHEKTNNIAVIDPKQGSRIIKWIDTSHRPRDMNFRDDRKQLLVACGDDD